MQLLSERAEAEMKDLGIFESPGSMDLMSIGEGTEVSCRGIGGCRNESTLGLGWLYGSGLPLSDAARKI